MIEIIKDYAACRDFAASFAAGPERLLRAIDEPERHCVLGVRRGGEMTGLFVFLVLPDERYLEMLTGLSRERDAYMEAFDYLAQHYPGFGADFVFSPDDALLMAELAGRGAEFDPEQQLMTSDTPPAGVDTTGVEPLSARYAAQYCALHSRDVYWNGERVLEAQDRFRTLLAVENGCVVGYLDATTGFEENEVFDLLVAEPHRRRGWGRRLLAEAMAKNSPHRMILHVDVDNTPAIRLYESLGFVKAPGQNSRTAHWAIPEAEKQMKSNAE